MHIPENYLSPATCAVMGAAMVPVWSHSIKKISIEMPKEKLPMLGVGAAFSFLSMMFNVPLVGGTTGHAVGGTLVALLFGPEAACIAVSVALLLQAVIFGDGGILAFGANCFNMAFILPFAGYYCCRLLMKLTGNKNEALRYISVAIGSYTGINLAALCASVEFGIQPLLFTDELGNALYCPYGLDISIPAMMIPHLAVAGLIEAAFTVAIYAFVRKTAPDMIYEPGMTKAGDDSGLSSGKTHFPIYALLTFMILATPLGLLATGTAWGEWGTDEIAGLVTNGQTLGYTPTGMASGWSLDTIMPDYSLDGMSEPLAYILSAVIGVALLIIIFKLFAAFRPGKKHY